jgi:hypothetical protein
MLATYKKDNPHITKAYIWLDGAGNLHNAGLLAVFADSEAHTGIRVLEVNHNEGARSQVAGPLATVARRNLLTALLQAARARRFWTASSVITRGP